MPLVNMNAYIQYCCDGMYVIVTIGNPYYLPVILDWSQNNMRKACPLACQRRHCHHAEAKCPSTPRYRELLLLHLSVCLSCLGVHRYPGRWRYNKEEKLESKKSPLKSCKSGLTQEKGFIFSSN